MKLAPDHWFALLVLIAMLFVLPFSASPALGATYFVDQAHVNANDTNSGLSESSPWRTLRRALVGGSGLLPIVAGDTVFVKNGTYDPAPELNFQPANAGTAAAPIAIRAFTPSSGARHRPILTRPLNAINNSPVIAVGSGRHFIIWDGFQTAPKTDILIANSNNVIIENFVIDKGSQPSTGGTGNYNGIFVQSATGTVIRNNSIKNVFYTTSTGIDPHENGAAIVLFDTRDTHIHNNEFSFCNVGIYDKRNGIGNVHERNYIHDMNLNGIRFDAFPEFATCGTCEVRDNEVRQNVLVNIGAVGVQVGFNAENLLSNIRIFNNTIVNVGQGSFIGARQPGFELYNNIIHVDASKVNAAHYAISGSAFGTPALGLLANFSNFTASVNPQARFRLGSTAQTFTQWQVNPPLPDHDSITLVPLFEGATLGQNLPVTNFRLRTDSPLINAGRTDGLATGSPITMGAYTSGADIIGIIGQIDLVPPAAPTNLIVH